MPVNDLDAARAIFEANTDLLASEDETDYNIYTEYKRGFPRYSLLCWGGFSIILFTDDYCHLAPLPKHVVPGDEHQEATEWSYSNQILDCGSAEQIAALPLPQFGPFFRGLCRKYIETQEVTAAISAELLVDGMDIDEEWCQSHFDASESDELNFALGLVSGKSSRIDDFSGNHVTCFIRDQEEADRIRKIPGFSKPLSK